MQSMATVAMWLMWLKRTAGTTKGDCPENLLHNRFSECFETSGYSVAVCLHDLHLLPHYPVDVSLSIPSLFVSVWFSGPFSSPTRITNADDVPRYDFT